MSKGCNESVLLFFNIMSTESTKTRRKQVYDMNEWKYCRVNNLLQQTNALFSMTFVKYIRGASVLIVPL
ncbi:hypothetical protein GLOIN_2v1662414, partial [Rhizophagus irregularis DAOM 181602=DAOM 197198]